jgi:hypothetical protein
VRRAYQLGPDWYAMWQAEAAKFQAETLTTSFLAALLREGDNVCHRCREQTGSVVHAAGDSREWLCSRCAFPPAAGAA